MPSVEENAKAPVAERLTRLERTPDELAGAVRGRSEVALARRPDPKLSFVESLALLRALTHAQWRRGGVHATRGRITIDDFVTVMAGHDDNHLDQLRRALEGRA
jgi:hypothetical protein